MPAKIPTGGPRGRATLKPRQPSRPTLPGTVFALAIYLKQMAQSIAGQAIPPTVEIDNQLEVAGLR